MTLTITDDDKGTITATVDGNVVRSWRYIQHGAQRHLRAMQRAREYAEGWHNRPELLDRDELLHVHLALIVFGQRPSRWEQRAAPSAEDHAKHLMLISKIADAIRASNPEPKAPQ